MIVLFLTGRVSLLSCLGLRILLARTPLCFVKAGILSVEDVRECWPNSADEFVSVSDS